MIKEVAFWDSSALVPLCVHEIRSRRAQAQLRRALPVVWWASPIEVHSAIARLHRLGNLNEADKDRAILRLTHLSRAWKEVLPGDSLRDLALRVLNSYELRAADSVQLAAALTWCQQRPARRSFVCADQRLSQAAVSAGFSVVSF